MQNNPDAIFNSFAAFAKFCIDKKEVPYFWNDSAKVDSFFYNIKQKYPKEFESVLFDTNGHQPFSETVSDAKSTMLTCGYLFSLTPRFNPHFVSKNLLKYSEKVEDKEVYLDVAKRLYDKFGCDINGNLEKRTNFESLENIH